MNHPFQAFGLMLVLLVVAMLAVSSTPHLTKSAGDRPLGCEALQRIGAPARQPLARRGRGAVFLVILPADDERAPEDAAGDATHIDAWRSHYDPIYDQIVYGYEPTTIAQQYKLRTMVLGLRNWLACEIQASSERFGWPLSLLADSATRSPPMEWSDYTALVDQIKKSETVPERDARPVDGSPTVAGLPLAVPSKRWVLRFAASSLNQAGLTLQAAASQLRQLEAESIARERMDYAR